MNDPWTPDTRPRREGCPVGDLLTAVRQASEQFPDSRVVRNPVGNLSVVTTGAVVGMLDLTFGEFVVFDPEQT